MLTALKRRSSSVSLKRRSVSLKKLARITQNLSVRTLLLRDNKEKKGKDHIGRSASHPWFMLEWRKYVAPRAWIVHQNHAGYGHSSENIKSHITIGFNL